MQTIVVVGSCCPRWLPRPKTAAGTEKSGHVINIAVQILTLAGDIRLQQRQAAHTIRSGSDAHAVALLGS